MSPVSHVSSVSPVVSHVSPASLSRSASSSFWSLFQHLFRNSSKTITNSSAGQAPQFTCFWQLATRLSPRCGLSPLYLAWIFLMNLIQVNGDYIASHRRSKIKHAGREYVHCTLYIVHCVQSREENSTDFTPSHMTFFKPTV